MGSYLEGVEVLLHGLEAAFGPPLLLLQLLLQTLDLQLQQLVDPGRRGGAQGGASGGLPAPQQPLQLSDLMKTVVRPGRRSGRTEPGPGSPVAPAAAPSEPGLRPPGSSAAPRCSAYRWPASSVLPESTEEGWGWVGGARAEHMSGGSPGPSAAGCLQMQPSAEQHPWPPASAPHWSLEGQTDAQLA